MIYLHVPFCESRCTYCGFFSNVILSEAQGNNENNENVILSEAQGNNENVILSEAKNLCYEAFADAVRGEIDDRREEIEKTLSVNTLYIGGGTPSVLPLDVLSRIVRTIESVSLSQSSNDENVILSDAKNLYPWSEFTIEVNPEDIIRKGDKYVKGLLALGVNRVSMGVQSFDDGILRWMNRRHDSAGAEEAFRILRRCGVSNISIDLIFGLPQLTDSVFEDTVGKALALGPEHISAYQLSVVEDSALAKMVATGRFTEASEERCRSQYDLLCARLAEAGYHHYEVSNFALPGREAVHNSAYWRRVPYVGLGPGAHSFSGGSVRSWNSGNLPVRLKDGSLKTYSREEEHLTDEDIRVERIMLALRTDAGLLEEELRSLAGDPSVVDRLLSDGALVRMGDPSVTSFPQDDKEEKHCHPEHSHCHPERSEGSLRISESHFFVSDEIIREII